jgi:hypothetical protein
MMVWKLRTFLEVPEHFTDLLNGVIDFPRSTSGVEGSSPEMLSLEGNWHLVGVSKGVIDHCSSDCSSLWPFLTVHIFSTVEFGGCTYHWEQCDVTVLFATVEEERQGEGQPAWHLSWQWNWALSLAWHWEKRKTMGAFLVLRFFFLTENVKLKDNEVVNSEAVTVQLVSSQRRWAPWEQEF